MILVNKADGNLKPSAVRTCADYAQALRLLRPRRQDPEGFPKAMTVSSLSGDGLAEAWAEIKSLDEWRRKHGHQQRRRAEQARNWFESEVQRELVARVAADRMVRDSMAELGNLVAEGKLFPANAVAELLRQISGS